MPCFSFPYLQGHFCRAMSQVFADEGSRARNYEIILKELAPGPTSAAEMRVLTEHFRDGKLDFKGEEEQKKIKRADVQHFFDHWLAPGAPIFHPRYGITNDEISQVLSEGYRRAIAEANEFDPPLPISVAWIWGHGNDPRFETVTIVNPHVHVQLLIVTPPTDMPVPPAYQPDPDNVFVTRLMRSEVEIQEIKDALAAIHAPPEAQVVLNPQNGDAGVDDIGTFRIWT